MAGPIIDVFMTRDHVVLKNDAYSLWCGRKDGKLMPGTEVHTTGLDSPVLLGQVWGCIGKIRFFSDADWKLLLIRHASSVGEMPRGENIYCIERIAVLPLTTDPSVEYMGLETPGTSDPGGLRPHSPALGKTRSTRASKEKNKELKDKEKLERRLTEALLWMFNESRSFYFCPEGDLTQVMQRQLANTELQQLPHWQRVDDRFFWNKKMLDDLLGDNYAGPLADPWVLPVVQGYVEIRQIPVQRLETPDTLQTWKPLQEGENRRKNSELQSQASTWGGYEMVELHEETRPSSTELDSLDQPDTVGERGGATSTSEVAPPEELDWYESDAESCKSRDTDDILDGYYGRLYACKEQLEEEEAREREKTREEGEATEGREKERANGGGDDSGDEGSADALVCEVGGTRGESVAMEDGGSKGVSMLEDETKEGVELGDKGSEGAGMQGQRYEPEEGIETEPSDRENLDHGSHFDQTSTLLSTEEHTECNHDHTATEPTTSSSIQEHHQDHHENQDHHQDHHENQDQEQGLNQNGAIPSGIPVTPDLSVAVKENGQQYVGALDEESVHDISTGAAEIKAPTPVVQNSEKSTSDGDKEALDGSDLHRDDIELAALSGDEDMEPAVNGLMTADKDGEVSCGYEKESATLGGDKDFRSQEGVTASNEGEDSGIESTLRLVGNEKEEEMFHRTLLEDPGEESELPAEEGVSPQLGDKKEATDFGVHLGQQKDYISPAVSSDEEEEEPEDTPTFTLVIISRRSRHRAGTRYRRRGVDKEGYVANYVETEMLIQAGAHQVSYVIVRGSVPVYWTQLGYKYRPPPIIEKGEEETQEAFREHFEQQLNLYKKMAIVNLVNQTGREGVLAEAYEKQILLLDNPLLTFVAFDFHRQYKLHGATPLLKATEDIKRRQKFCWLNTELGEDPLCMQEGVFRVNCMDCLDRTNVIQSLLCRQVLQTTLHKLGVLPFEEKLGESTLREYQEMWANNGDIISRQYTGTRAMKGDLTRYGERKFYGMMKDGYNSAHRYYQNVFRDAYRQVLIDLMQGYSPSEAFASLSPSMRMLDEDIPAIIPITAVEVDDSELWSLDREQAIADMIQQCKYELFADKSLHIQGWAVMEAAGYSFVESSQKEEACVLLQCREKSQLCVANYNSEIDQVICFIRIPMEKIEKIVIGSLGTLLRSSKRLHMRIYYSLVEDKTCYFTFKTVNFTSVEDDKAILSGIATALSYIQPSITVHVQKLTKKRSPDHEGVAYLVMPDEWREWAELEPPVEDNKAPLSHNSKMTEKTGSATSHTAEKKANLAVRIIEDDQIEQDLEDEQEISFSAPSSPKLIRRHPLQLHKRTRSQSFDDILSCVNNEVIPPASINSQIIPRSPAKKSSVLQPLYDSDSGSESDVETYKVSTTGRTASESDLRGSQKELEDSESGQRSQTSAFTRFKGRFLQKMKFGAQKQQHLSSGSVTSQEAEDSDAQTISQVTQTMAQKFRNSPGLLRKVGVNRKNKSPQPPQPSEEDIKRKEARERSQTRFLLI